MLVMGHVIYRQNGGSGFGISYNEVMDMEWVEILWWAERLNEKRAAEAKAAREGSR